MLMMGNQDADPDRLNWKSYILIASSLLLLLGIVLLATNFARIYLRLSSFTLIFAALGGYAIVLTALIANRYYRTWQLVIGSIVAILLFLAAFVFFFMSLQY
jgi:uncharacterized membrane protein HdeD (DUF308 family)